jgi:hypothetical protein
VLCLGVIREFGAAARDFLRASHGFARLFHDIVGSSGLSNLYAGLSIALHCVMFLFFVPFYFLFSNQLLKDSYKHRV